MKEYKGHYELNNEILEWDALVDDFEMEEPYVTDVDKCGVELRGVRKKPRQKPSLKKRIITTSITFVCLVSMYLTIVYSDIPFIEKWRTIYIETAMTTTSHKWLATLFFPQSVIDEVMNRQKDGLKEQKKLSSTWDDDNADLADLNAAKQKNFFETYWELDSNSVRAYLEAHPQLAENGYNSILIEDFEQTLKLETVYDDPIYVIDTENNLIIIGVSGEGFQGKMAIVKNPAQVCMEKSTALGSYGQDAESFGVTNDAILVMNASGFKDVKGEGTGGEVKGSLLIDGKEYGYPSSDSTWKFCGMKNNNKMYVTSYPSGEMSEYKWGMEFRPALIVDGVAVVNDTFGMGIQPRATIGQTKDGDMLLLVVDGRQIGYSIGCTVEDCTNIFVKYKGYQGMNLDGGSSAVMWYKGNYITSSCSVTGEGRYMPNAFIVKKASDIDTIVKSEPAED